MRVARPSCITTGVAVALALSFTLTATTTLAAPTARLVYSRAPGAESCANEEALRRAVAARIGYDPFFPWATKTIVASMATLAPAGFVASVNLVDESGIEHGARALHTSGSCAELLDAAALAIALAIDPLGLARGSATPATAPAGSTAPSHGADPNATASPSLASPSVAPPATPAAAAPGPGSAAVLAPSTSTPPFVTGARAQDGERPVTSREGAATRTLVQATAGVVGSSGVAPLVSVGFTAGAAIRRGDVSLGVEARVDVPSSAQAQGGGRVSSWLAEVAILPCGHLGPFFGCAVGQLGSSQVASEGVLDRRSESVVWGAVGGRLGVRLLLPDSVGLRVWSDVLCDLDPTIAHLNAMTAWQAPRIASSLGADVALTFR